MDRAVGNDLKGFLEAIDRPLTFCAESVAPAILPDLCLDDHGSVPLPVNGAQADQLAAVGEAAPYGQGTRTVVDPAVRRVTMFPPARVRIAHPGWDAWLADRVDEIRERLGLAGRELRPRLHQMLLYRRGDFFLPHRDGEKQDGMVATMAVVLPSYCTGGDLLVRHGGEERRIAFDGPGRAFEFQVAAWYADCEHEIEPLADGCRLVLIYNLVLHRSRRRVRAPTFTREIDGLTRVLGGWARGMAKGPPRRLVITLEHAYSQRGLRPDRLKGRDAARAQALFAAARGAGCRAYLVHLTYREVGEAITDYEGYYGPEPDDEDVEMGELIDDELTAEHWTEADGARTGFGVLPIADEEILGGLAELKRTVAEQEFEGYTGNAGMELTRWYHRAALVFWPAAQHATVLCGGSLTAGIAGLEEAVARLQQRPTDAARRQEARSFAEAVLDAWPERGRWSFIRPVADPGRVAALLTPIADAELTTRYVARVLRQDIDEDPGRAIVDLAEGIGWPALLAAVKDLFAHSGVCSLERDARLLATLCRRLPKDARHTGRRLAERLADIVMQAGPDRDSDLDLSPEPDRGAALQSLFAALHDLDARQLMRQVAAAIDKDRERFELAQVQVPAALALAKRRKRLPDWPPFRRWLECCRDGLARRIAAPPRPPPDWARAGVTSCDCVDCAMLDAFLRDPRRKRERFPLRKDRRQHLHRIIDHERLDATHQTERRGSPHTLVCQKTDGSYRRLCERHRGDVTLHERLEVVLAG